MRRAATVVLVYLLAVALAAPKPQLLHTKVDSVKVGSHGELANVNGVRVYFVNRMVIGQFTLFITLL